MVSVVKLFIVGRHGFVITDVGNEEVKIEAGPIHGSVDFPSPVL